MRTTMNRELLTNYLQDPALIDTFKSLIGYEEKRDTLCRIKNEMKDIGVFSAESLQEAERRWVTLCKLVNESVVMIETIFGLTWQMQEIVRRYMDSNLDDLPEVATW